MIGLSMISRGWNNLLSAIFPRFCVQCRGEGNLLCDVCAAAWRPSRPEDEHAWSLLHYADPIARQLITSWKYQLDQSAFEILCRRLSGEMPLLRLRAGMAGIQAIVPVPLDYRRKAWRGFDQSEEIGKWLSAELKIPFRPLLRRKLAFGHQADRSTENRQKAMANSPFALATQDIPERILLVDDVWTTGSTMRAAEAALPQCRVHFFTIAKGG